MRPKLAALVVAASLTIGWLLASVVSPPVAKLQVLPDRAERRAPPRTESVTAPYTEQLHFKLQQAPRAPVTRRNPFVFGSPRKGGSAPLERGSADAATNTAANTAREGGTDAVEAPATPVVTGPSLRLSGIGSTGGVRTAVISDGTTVHLVKAGETVRGYSVVEISEDAVTIADAAGAQWTLRMKP